MEDGRLYIGNNLTENSIRNVALGGTQELYVRRLTRRRSTRSMMYSFFATCKINNIEPFSWLKETLTKIADQSANKLDELLPGAIKQ